ncbi:MAG: hypothetical protein B7X91_11435 [Hydrogenophilales bacterium 17-64-11]|nr:MAG: hypothetical protein B7X91_11435 [Hydrogenophilales bacterium 17-64-11]
MKRDALNIYGDGKVLTKGGLGVDVASQREDDLDRTAIEFIRARNSPSVLEIGCGLGGQSLRMAEAGAVVTALDMHDYSESMPSHDRITFVQGDLSSFEPAPAVRYDAIFSQRTIHYLPFDKAVAALKRLVENHLSPGGTLFLSASGLQSELGRLYPHDTLRVGSRFTSLSPDMAEKHGIHAPVCLYTCKDMAELISACGLTPGVWASPFGNIKAIGVSC